MIKRTIQVKIFIIFPDKFFDRFKNLIFKVRSTLAGARRELRTNAAPARTGTARLLGLLALVTRFEIIISSSKLDSIYQLTNLVVRLAK